MLTRSVCRFLADYATEPVVPLAWIPDSMTALTALRHVLFDRVNITSGALPSSWSLLTGLQSISLASSPNVTGALPPSWSALNGLRLLRLRQLPGLSGGVPAGWLGAFGQLQNVSLSG